MYGIHGIPAFRTGRFQEIVEKSFSGISLMDVDVPEERLIADLKFIIQSQPFSVWELSSTVSSNSYSDNEEITSDTLDELQVSALVDQSKGLEWWENAKKESEDWLANIENDPNEALKLKNFIKKQQGDKNQLALGKYYANMLEYWLTHCEELNVSKVCSSIRISEGNTNLGALKFVWVSKTKDQQDIVFHLESSIKFFAKHGDYFVGPHLSETLQTRYDFAKRKLGVAKIAKTKLGKLLDCSGSEEKLHSMALIQGHVFFPFDENDELEVSETLQSDAMKQTIQDHKSHIHHDNHLRGWYTLDFNRVSKKLSEPYKCEEERWAVLPKLYWMSPVQIPASEEQIKRFALPLLDRNEMKVLLDIQFGTPRKVDEESKKKRKRRSGYVNIPPVLIAQVVLKNGTWCEVSRGFVMPKDWDPNLLVEAEVIGNSDVPNLPTKLCVKRASRVICTTQEQDLQERLEQANILAMKESTKRIGKSCDFCSKFNLEKHFETVKSIPARLSLIVGSLYGLQDVFDQNHLQENIEKEPIVLNRSFISNSHTQHMIPSLATSLVTEFEELDKISLFILEACHHLALPETFRLTPKEKKSVVRILLRSFEQVARQFSMGGKKITNAIMYLIQSPTFPNFVIKSIDNQDDQILGLIFSLNAFKHGHSVKVSCDAHQKQKITTFIAELVEKVESWGENEAKTLLGLMKVFEIEFDDDALPRYLEKLIAAHKLDCAEELVKMGDSVPFAKYLFRLCILKERNYRRSLTLRKSFQLNDYYVPVTLSRDRGAELPKYESKFQWKTHMVGSVGTCNDLEKNSLYVLMVDSIETLKEATTLLDNLIAETKREDSHSRVCIGIDSEWGLGIKGESIGAQKDDVPDLLALFQVALQDNHVLLVDFHVLFSRKDLQEAAIMFLDKLFDGSTCTLVGFSLHEDLRRLREMLGHVSAKKPIMSVIDVQAVLAGFSAQRYVDGFLGDPFGVSLANWCQYLLNVAVDKEWQCSDWTQRPLETKQIQYAALDAVAPLELLNCISSCQQSPLVISDWAVEEPLCI